MRRLILGTAGHIDHGKTALVKALTGTDTDRLKEEKERGITVDLGFAEFSPGGEVHFGVVDVPGHEGFIRNMLAGASGMDLVLLVVAADEGVMPQTREHLAIVRFLEVPRMVVAITKADLVEEEWLELVGDEVRELLAESPYADAPILPVSAQTGDGVPELERCLARLGMEARERGGGDLVRLPLDRIFTIRGTGTVVTGTLWSGTLRVGERIRILPGDREGRVRSLQLHGAQVEAARAGSRVAVGLTGSEISRQGLDRGQTLTQGEGWESSWMLTCRVSVLDDSGWELEQGQRLRVHLGTAEVLGRAALLGTEVLRGGEEGWVQLRLEEPILARVRDRLVLRSYSPVTTLGGGIVAEVLPRKRRSMAPGEDGLLRSRIEGDPDPALGSLLVMEGWRGARRETLPQRTGFAPSIVNEVLDRQLGEGRAREVEGFLISGGTWEAALERVLEALEDYHGREPLRAGRPLEEVRQALPGPMGPALAEAAIRELSDTGRIHLGKGLAALQEFTPTLSKSQEELRKKLRSLLEAGGLAPPSLREMAEALSREAGLEELLQLMEHSGEVVALDDGLYFVRDVVQTAARSVVSTLGGAQDLGPADFREVLPVTRKHLLPLLRYFDTVGVTTRREERRTVALSLPAEWAEG